MDAHRAAAVNTSGAFPSPARGSPRDRLINVISLDIADGAVQTVRSVINPDKLAHLGPLSPAGRRSVGPDWA